MLRVKVLHYSFLNEACINGLYLTLVILKHVCRGIASIIYLWVLLFLTRERLCGNSGSSHRMAILNSRTEPWCFQVFALVLWCVSYCFHIRHSIVHVAKVLELRLTTHNCLEYVLWRLWRTLENYSNWNHLIRHLSYLTFKHWPFRERAPVLRSIELIDVMLLLL